MHGRHSEHLTFPHNIAMLLILPCASQEHRQLPLLICPSSATTPPAFRQLSVVSRTTHRHGTSHTLSCTSD